MTDLVLFDSLTRSLRRFAPIDPANVRIYTCGPTVYNYQHIGNMRAFLFADTLGRVLRWKGYPTTHVINITDVGHLTSDADAGDDKMETAAAREGRSIWEIAAHYTDAFKRDVARLNIVAPTRWAVATDHIAEMIAFAETIAPAHCYELEDGLYFDVSTVPDYGRLAGSSGDEREARIAAVAGKRHPQDFAIWRRSAPGETRQMEWDSPWGRGAPGWHLECSVMSKTYLGDRFDIHTGGIDHREIHHPNEIAQNQAYDQAHCDCADTGANWWMHNNFLVERGGKMSKSSGEFLTLQALIDRGFHPLAYRMMCLQAHYRSELEFSWESLAAASVRLKRLVRAISKYALSGDDALQRLNIAWVDKDWTDFRSLRNAIVASMGAAALKWMSSFEHALSEDLNTPAALTVLDNVFQERAINTKERAKLIAIAELALGLGMRSVSIEDLRVRPSTAVIDDADVEARLAERLEARAAKDFPRSDAIRAELAAAGVEVMDGDPLGWDWKPTV